MMKKTYLFIAVCLFTSMSFAQMDDQDLPDACYRGPNSNKVWMDSPTPEFYNELRSLGYDKMEALGAGYKICRDSSLKGSITDKILKERNLSQNKRKISEYIENMRNGIAALTQNCRPGKRCTQRKFYFPLEGTRNDNSVCQLPEPLQWNNIEICQTGSSSKIWIDRPTASFVQYLLSSKKYGILKALGVAYRVCRGRDSAGNSYYAKEVLEKLFKTCPAQGRCNADIFLPLEGHSNRRIPLGYNCRY